MAEPMKKWERVHATMFHRFVYLCVYFVQRLILYIMESTSVNNLIRRVRLINIRKVQPPQEVTKNIKLMEDLLADNCEFTKWKYQTFNRPYHLVKLKSRDELYNLVAARFNYTMTSPIGAHYALNSVLRVENPFLLAQFYLRKTRLDRIEKRVSVNLFHGTRSKNLNPICRDNFNWRLTGKYLISNCKLFFFIKCVL